MEEDQGLSYTQIITGRTPGIDEEDQDAWNEYNRIYVKPGLSHACDWEWFRDMIYPQDRTKK